MTEPSSPPYTEATEEAVKIVAAVLLKQYDQEFDASHLSWQDFAGAAREVIEAVQPALIAAGRAQAAADIRAAARIEYGVEHTYPGQEPIGLPAVNRWAAERAAAQSGGVATRRLVERTTWSTPWREAAERDEDSRTDMDEPSLPASTGAPIHGPTSSGGHVG